MSMNTPLGSVKETTPINSFKELTSMELNQYLLGINNILQGDGARITLQNLIKGIISTDENNLIDLDNEGRLTVTSGAFNLDTGWVTAPNLTIDWSAGTITGAGGVFYLNGVILTALSNFLVSDLPTDIGQHFLYYNSQSGEFEWSVGYPTTQSDYVHHIVEVVILADGNKFAIQTWGFGGISKELIDYLNNTIGMTILEGGNIGNVVLDNAESRKPTISQTKIGTADFSQTFGATQTGETYTLAHANGNTIVLETSKTEIVPVGSSGMAQYLSDNGLTDLETEKFMNVWLFALPTVSTNPNNMNYLYITGSGQYDTLVNAKVADFSKDKTIKILSEKFYRYCPIARFTIQNSEGNFSIADYGNISSISASSSSSGSLSGGGGGGLEVCDIGMALYVDESKGLRRYLNGQIVDINTNTQAFLDRLLQIQTTTPDYFTTEDNWQAEATLNIDGCVYKFVLNYSGETVVSVRLPKYPDYVEINAGGTLPVVGNGMALGLTNGTTNGGVLADSTSKLLVYRGPYGANVQNNLTGEGTTIGQGFYGVTTDPTKSGIQTTLNQTKLKMRYFIQIATGSETENNIINDIELNNPYSLFDSKYSDHELFNLSWLKSNGQWNAKAVYPTAYDKLLKVYNGTETVEGLSVKLSTEEYTDYDFVLNTADETFRLPLKTKLASGKAVVGNGMVLGLTDGTNNFGFQTITGQNIGHTMVITGAYGKDIGSANGSSWVGDNKVFGVTSDPAKSGIELSDSDLYLYYYVGETVQNANLIDAGRIGEQLATKTDMLQASGASMPSDKYIDLTLGASGSTYTAPANGWFCCGGGPSTGSGSLSFEFNKGMYQQVHAANAGEHLGLIRPVLKGDTLTINYGNMNGLFLNFTYAQGSEGEV